MDENEREQDTQPIPSSDSENAADSAKPDKKPIDDTSESSEERREHPGLADDG